MPERRALRLPAVVVTIALLAALTGCSTGGSGDTVSGVVTQVTGDLGSVDSFVITDSSGESYQFTPTEGLTFHGGPLDHLREHIVSGEAVEVRYETADDGSLVALEVGDAG